MADPIDKTVAEHYNWGDGCDGWHLLKHPDLSVIQERVPPKSCEIRHFHNKARQFFYVLSGIATIELDGKVVTFGPNQGLHVPPGVPHRFVNNGDTDVTFLLVSSPPTAGDRVISD
jgi:mannose-6-phosphate isomerase-like protein (cupin superfamily)